MLCLSRKVNEEVVVTVPPSSEPTVVVVTTVETRRDKVRLGFVAKQDVTIHRREVQDEVDARKEARA